MEELQHKLFDAAIKGNITSLQKLLKEDPIILERSVTNRFSETPLHVAAMLGHTDFVKEVVRSNPQLTTELDSLQSSPLHLASAKGQVDVVRTLLSANPQTRLARDRNRLTPLHLATLKGRIEVMKVLLQEIPNAAELTVYKGENILHQCVKHNQLEALKLLVNKVSNTMLINAKDTHGDTLLHLAVAYKQVETIEFLVAIPGIDVNSQDLNGMTAMDTLIRSKRDMRDAEIQNLLKHAGGVAAASHMDQAVSTPCSMHRNNQKHQDDWLDKKRSALMIVASLVATMAFQAGVNPPGGLWQEDSRQGNSNSGSDHRAGFSIMADNYPGRYTVYYILNTASFISSLSIILLLISGLPIKRKLFVWILMVITWIAITGAALSYAIVIISLTPLHLYKRVSYLVGCTIYVWVTAMGLLLISHTIRMIVKLL